MKIGEVRPVYYANRKALQERLEALNAMKEKAENNYRITGQTSFNDEAATLEISIDSTKALFEENQKVLDSINDQYCNYANLESTRQQGEAARKMGEDMAKIMTVFRRMAHGDIVPQTDEKKLMEFDDKMYASAKNLQTMAMMREKEREKHDSLWEDEEKTVYPDPGEVADDSPYTGPLPDIEIPNDIAAGKVLE